MVRLKFVVFALLVMGLWIGAISALSSGLGQTLVEQGGRQAEVASAAAAQSATGRRQLAQHALLGALGDPAVIGAAAKPARLLDPQKVLAGARVSAAQALPEDARKDLIVAFVTENAGAVAKGPEGEDSVEGLDLAALAKVGLEGAVVAVGGVQHQFVSAAVLTPALPEPRQAGTLVAGVPLLPPQFAEGLVRHLGLAAVRVLEAGKVVTQAGAKNLGVGAEDSVPLGSVAVVGRGGTVDMGPIHLPLLTHGDLLGGGAPVAVASRQALQGTPYEVLAVVSLRSAMKGLAEAQQVALLSLAGLLVLSFVWTLLLGAGAPKGEPEPMTDPAVRAARKGEVLKLGFDASAKSAAAEGSPLPELPPPPEPNPDDFQFAAPAEPKTQAPSPLDLPPVPDTALPPSSGGGPDPFAAFDSDRVPTRAYPVANDDPFGADGAEEYNPDATRVAAVSDELLRASARSTGEQPAAPARPAGNRSPAIVVPPAAAPAGPAAGGDEAHFQDIYRDFVSTRERCGEPADGLTFDKFAAKLRKNREQLIQKYNCRTVRFQVYVKEGKAALKATPVKE